MIALTPNFAESAPDDRDYPYEPIADALIDHAAGVDLRLFTGAIEDQRRVGSCSANATVSACELLLQRRGHFVDLSRLFNFYKARQLEGHLRDGVETLRSNLQSALHDGIPPEALWNYSEALVNVEPTQGVVDAASLTRMMRYEKIDMWDRADGTKPKADLIKSALSEGYPVVIGMALGHKWMKMTGPLQEQSYSPLIVQDPENYAVGGHAMTIVGWLPNEIGYGSFIVENSWGTDWGDNGYGALPHAALLDVFEAWVVKGFNGDDCAKHSAVLKNTAFAAAAVKALADQQKVQEIIDACIDFEVSPRELEVIMGWPVGSVKAFKETDFGKQFDWKTLC